MSVVITKSDRFSRRALLKTMGLGAGMLPLLHTERAHGQVAGSGFPKRLVLVTWPNGVIKSSFNPPGQDLVFGDTIKALEPFKSKVLMPIGLGLNLATY